jgi:hypothetical protein
VASAGDVNGDGYADIIVGALFADPLARTNAGAVYVLFGKQSGFATVDLNGFPAEGAGFIIQGAAAGDYAGYSVAGAGDVNGDGYGDLIVGARGADPLSRTGGGAAYVILGGDSMPATVDLNGFPDGAEGFAILGAATGDAVGYSVAGAGDVNADGYSDLILGAHRADPQARNLAGTGYVVLGGF